MAPLASSVWSPLTSCHALQLDPVVAVAHRRGAARRRPPLDALRADGERRQVDLLMIGMEDDVAVASSSRDRCFTFASNASVVSA